MVRVRRNKRRSVRSKVVIQMPEPPTIRRIHWTRDAHLSTDGVSSYDRLLQILLMNNGVLLKAWVDPNNDLQFKHAAAEIVSTNFHTNGATHRSADNIFVKIKSIITKYEEAKKKIKTSGLHPDIVFKDGKPHLSKDFASFKEKMTSIFPRFFEMTEILNDLPYLKTILEDEQQRQESARNIRIPRVEPAEASDSDSNEGEDRLQEGKVNLIENPLVTMAETPQEPFPLSATTIRDSTSTGDHAEVQEEYKVIISAENSETHAPTLELQPLDAPFTKTSETQTSIKKTPIVAISRYQPISVEPVPGAQNSNEEISITHTSTMETSQEQPQPQSLIDKESQVEPLSFHTTSLETQQEKHHTLPMEKINSSEDEQSETLANHEEVIEINNVHAPSTSEPLVGESFLERDAIESRLEEESEKENEAMNQSKKRSIDKLESPKEDETLSNEENMSPKRAKTSLKMKRKEAQMRRCEYLINLYNANTKRLEAKLKRHEAKTRRYEIETKRYELKTLKKLARIHDGYNDLKTATKSSITLPPFEEQRSESPSPNSTQYF